MSTVGHCTDVIFRITTNFIVPTSKAYFFMKNPIMNFSATFNTFIGINDDHLLLPLGDDLLAEDLDFAELGMEDLVSQDGRRLSMAFSRRLSLQSGSKIMPEEPSSKRFKRESLTEVSSTHPPAGDGAAASIGEKDVRGNEETPYQSISSVESINYSSDQISIESSSGCSSWRDFDFFDEDDKDTTMMPTLATPRSQQQASQQLLGGGDHTRPTEEFLSLLSPEDLNIQLEQTLSRLTTSMQRSALSRRQVDEHAAKMAESFEGENTQGVQSSRAAVVRSSTSSAAAPLIQSGSRQIASFITNHVSPRMTCL